MIQDLLTIAIIETDVIWENPDANRKKLDHLLRKKGRQTDIILLPEMFNTGFTMHSRDMAETMDGESVEWMKEKAFSLKTAVCGSLIIKEENRFYNRLIWVSPDAGISFYDKRHLFRMGEEDKHFSRGENKLIINYKGWKIYPLICYDLRFPVWSRNKNNYDLLIYLANWPSSRQAVWDILLRARAIENQSWVAGVNRIGIDGTGINYVGGSCIVNAKGENITGENSGEEEIIFKTISYKELLDFRTKFPVWKDADDFSVK